MVSKHSQVSCTESTVKCGRSYRDKRLGQSLGLHPDPMESWQRVLRKEIASLNHILKKSFWGNSLAVQWLGLRPFTARGLCFSCLFVFLCLFFISFFFLLVIHFTHISVYMSIPIAQFITPPPPPPATFPLGVHTFFLYFHVSISALQTSSSVPFSRFHIYALIYDI